ncbi:MAG: hypothetical protein ACD_79C01302G0018 [uncultured bacterium]|nr:MAG: hypothetical protein ACD_79C01302G0018 [uncultured bacterium]
MKKLLIVLDFHLYINFVYDAVKILLEDKYCELYFFSKHANLLNKVSSSFPVCKIVKDQNNIIDEVSPNLIVCFDELWNYNFFLTAREKNIPIIHYDHGSHFCRSYYVLDKDDITCSYRGDVCRCSHIVCWGKNGRDNWLTYGVMKEKYFITGGIQFDVLYRKNLKDIEIRKEVYKKLNIPLDKKIILFFSLIRYTNLDPKIKKRNIEILDQLKTIVNKDDHYQLIIKPHPVDLLSNKPSPYPENAKIIFNPFEECKETNAIEIDVNQVIAHSYAVISLQSSVIISPLILNIPIIYIYDGTGSSKDLMKFGSKAFINVNKRQRLASILDNLNKIYDEKRKAESQRLAALMNYNNDGKANIRFVDLIYSILKKSDLGEKFYIPEEKEYFECNKRFPKLPYSYKNLFIYYCKNNDLNNAELWLDKYMKKFKQFKPLLDSLKRRKFLIKKTENELIRFYEKYKRNLTLNIDEKIQLASSYRENNFYNKAISILKNMEGIKISKNQNKNRIYEIALNYLMLGNYRRAISLLCQASKITPKNDSSKYRIYFRLGESFFKLNNYQKAKKYLTECIKSCPGHNAALLLLKKTS